MCTGWRTRRLVNRLPAFGFMGCVLDTRGLWRVAAQIRHVAEGSAMALARIQVPSAVGAPARITADSVDCDCERGLDEAVGYAPLRGLLIVRRTHWIN